MVFHEMGYEVLLVGRVKSDSMAMNSRVYDTKRMKLIFEKGVMFYAEFQIRLFLFLLFKPKSVLVANDLDTLWPNYRISKLKGAELIYDSHEIFCEVPELQNNPKKKRIWEKLEGRIVPKLKYCITVNQSIANWFYNKYKVKFNVVRNITNPLLLKSELTRQDLKLPIDTKLIILQGAGINVDRGAEELIESMQYVDNAILLIVGGGDVIETLKDNCKKLNLESKVIFIPKQNPENLLHYTKCADIGLSIDKNSNINYQFSLPNKIFDYLHAGVPVLVSRLTEIEKIVSKYNVGTFIENHEPKHIAEQINFMLSSNEYNTWKANTKKASEENNWENEQKVWKEIISALA